MADPHWGPVEERPQGAVRAAKRLGLAEDGLRGILITIGALTVLGLISAIAVVVYRLHHDTAVPMPTPTSRPQPPSSITTTARASWAALPSRTALRSRSSKMPETHEAGRCRR